MYGDAAAAPYWRLSKNALPAMYGPAAAKRVALLRSLAAG